MDAKIVSLLATIGFLSSFVSCDDDDIYVVLTSNGPAVLDSEITFNAVLYNAEDYEGPFFFSYNDDASPRQNVEQKTNERVSNWTIKYSSKTYEPKRHVMTLRVYAEELIFRKQLAETKLEFSITKQLNGKLVVRQNGTEIKENDHLVASTQNVDVSVDLHDPSHFLSGAVIKYFWFVNDTNYGPSENATFTYQFSRPGRSTIEAMVMATVSGSTNPELHGNLSAAVDSLSAVSADTLVLSAPPYVKTGVFRAHVASRTPITHFNSTGDTWLKHGKMLELVQTCDGSGPWSYCWKIVPNPYNATGNETCSDEGLFPSMLVTACEFPVAWYFRDYGIYDILMIVDNGVSRHSRLVHVNIYEVHRQTQLSIVIIPIVSVLVAVMVVTSGIISVITFRRNVAVETADFDFNSPEEQLEYKTFWERLRDSMLNAFANSTDDVSHVSSVSSRSVQHGPVSGIHYGSIS